MNLETAIQRLKWRFTNGKFNPNQNDLDAFKFLIQWIINQKNQAKNHHYAFQKLYAIHLYHKMLHTHDIREANIQIVQELKIPANQHYTRLLEHLNIIELDKLLDFLKVKTEIQYKYELKAIHNKLTEKDKLNNKKIYQENHQIIQKHLDGIWEEKDFFNRLDNQITEALNRFNSIEK